MKILVLAGGSGTRLFPLSRSKFPKQFLRLEEGKPSLFQQTVKRALRLTENPEDLLIVTNAEHAEHKFLVERELEEVGASGAEVLLEPEGRNTAPAIALAVKFLKEKGLENEHLFVMPSDHLISPLEKFVEGVLPTFRWVEEGYILTYGIRPTKPETGYGYVEAEEALGDGVFKVKKFHEKPDRETAIRYLSSGNFYWNSGMFAFSLQTILEEFKRHAPEIYRWIEEDKFENALASFGKLPEISIDYAIMEKTDRAAVKPLDLFWSDVGSWDSVYEILPKDKEGNAVVGTVKHLGARNSLFFSASGRLVAAIDVEDLAVVDTDDAILITKRSSSQKVKELVKLLKSDPRFKKLTEFHTLVHRPWGSYKVLYEEAGVKIKKITVKPGAALSLQLHYHRSEHWIVVRGTAKVVLEDEKGNLREIFLRENESIFVPKTRKHRLINPGKVPLEIIEVQVGDYLEEDDIVRFEDKYNRV